MLTGPFREKAPLFRTLAEWPRMVMNILAQPRPADDRPKRRALFGGIRRPNYATADGYPMEAVLMGGKAGIPRAARPTVKGEGQFEMPDSRGIIIPKAGIKCATGGFRNFSPLFLSGNNRESDWTAAEIEEAVKPVVCRTWDFLRRRAGPGTAGYERSSQNRSMEYSACHPGAASRVAILRNRAGVGSEYF
jgi:hypothetical protein